MYSYFATMTVVSSTSNSTLTPPICTLSFNESVEALNEADVMFVLTNPSILHIKNFRGGNHMYNLLNIKAVSVSTSLL